MSEKRYTFTEYHGRETEVVGAVLDNGEEMGHDDAARLLNQQAETIEVLREWINNYPINDDFNTIDEFERKLIRYRERGQAALTPDSRVELAKRRIAALEGTNE